ncbi:hypothetical protein [Paenibacillus donghaensis]|uniref:hypothetical protein n=1 Tax=Paenibacillus donghaensis TaxID=414771 RepID=UPI0012FD2F47|nr:hypothetical protein [Paenibacillus donghaensis]
MGKITWKKGIDQIINQGATRVYKEELLNSISKELNNRKVIHKVFRASTEEWIVTIG